MRKIRKSVRRTNEAQEFEVELSDMDGGTDTKMVKKTVQAVSDEEAVRKAMQGDPQAANYDEVKITKKKVGEPVHESLSYPYSIMLPKSYEKTLRGGLKGTDLRLEEKHARLYLKVLDKGQMKKLLENMGKSKDGRARQVVEGILGSVR